MSPETATAWQRRMRGFVFSQSFAGSTIRTTLACLAVAAGIAGWHGVVDASHAANSNRNSHYGDASKTAHGGQLRDEVPAATVAAIVESRCPGQTNAPLRRFIGNSMAGFWKALRDHALHLQTACGGISSPHESPPPAAPTLLSLGMMLRL